MAIDAVMDEGQTLDDTQDLDQEVVVDDEGVADAPPPQSKFKVGSREFDDEQAAQRYLDELDQEAATYRNSRAVQEARAREIQAQQAQEEQERAYYAAYQQAAEVALKDIAQGRPQQGLGKLMDFSVRLAEHRVSQQFEARIAQLQAQIDQTMEPIMFERAQGLDDLKDFQEEALFLKDHGGKLDRPSIVKFLRHMREKISGQSEQGGGKRGRMHVVGSEGPGFLSDDQKKDMQDFEKISKKFWG